MYWYEQHRAGKLTYIPLAVNTSMNVLSEMYRLYLANRMYWGLTKDLWSD